MALYELSTEAQNDLFEIWTHIAVTALISRIASTKSFMRSLDRLGRRPARGTLAKTLPGARFCFSLFTPT
jgi:plasmid stabilization system protein ParE